MVQLAYPEVYQRILRSLVVISGTFRDQKIQAKANFQPARNFSTARGVAWDFLERYNAEMLLVEELQTQVAVLTLLNRLLPGHFKSSLSKRPTRTPKEIQMRAEKYIFLEETEKVTASSGRNQFKKKNANQDERLRKVTRSRVRKYHEYTPSTCPSPIRFKKSNKLKDFPIRKLWK